MEKQMKFYRYNQNYDEYSMTVVCDEYRLLRETPKGYWIVPDYSHFDDVHHKRWIPKESIRRFAYPKKAEALHNFKMRKKHQIEILTSQLKYAKMALVKVDQMEVEE
jgi:uncharacterized protein (DUF2461 family)